MLLVVAALGAVVACAEQVSQVAAPDLPVPDDPSQVVPETDAAGLPGAIELPNSGLSFVGSGPSPRDVCTVTSVNGLWKWELKSDPPPGVEYSSGTEFIGPDPYDSISSALGAFPDTLKKAKFVPKTKKDSKGCEYDVGFLNFTVQTGVVASLFPADTVSCAGPIYSDFDKDADDCLVTRMDVEWDVTRIYQALDVVASMPWQYGKPWYEGTSGATITADYVGGWPGATLTYSWTISNKSNRTGSGDIVSNCASSTASTCVVTFDIDDCGTFDISVEISDGTTTATDITRTVTVYNCSPPTASVFGPSLINYNGQTCGYFGSASGGVAPYSGPVWDGLSSGVNGWSTTLTGGPTLNTNLYDLEFSITDDMGRVATTAYNVDHDMTNSQPLCPT